MRIAFLMLSLIWLFYCGYAAGCGQWRDFSLYLALASGNYLIYSLLNENKNERDL